MSVKNIVPFLLVLLCLFACNDSSSDDFSAEKNNYLPPIAAGDSAVQTLFVYMVADNNLASFAQKDLAEILQASSMVPHDCYMLAFIDDNNSPRILRYFNNNGTGDYETVYNFEREVASCDTAEMRVVFDWVLKNFPTKKLDLVMWSHANGWLGDETRPVTQYAFGYDAVTGNEASGRRTEISELAEFLKNISVKPDRLMFDACFMQCVEVAYELRNSADWVIASPAEIPGYGAPYDALLPLFFDSSSDNIENILNAYKAAYSGSKTGVVLSAVRLEAMSDLADATAVVLGKGYFDKSVENEYDGVFAYLPDGDFSSAGNFPDYYDMNSVMLKNLPADEYAAWKAVFDNAVPYRCADAKWYTDVKNKDVTTTEDDYIMLDDSWGGVACYIPKNNWRYERYFTPDFKNCGWYDAVGWNTTGW